MPAKRPHPQPVVSPQPGAIIQNYGTIGAVQTGADSTANVQQQWVSGDTSELQAALAMLRQAIERAQDAELPQRGELLADVDRAAEELRRERPDAGRLLRWLDGIGTAVSTIASIQPAYEAVKTVARALGAPL